MCMRVSRKWSEPVPWRTISWCVFMYLQYLRPRSKGCAMPRALHHLIFRPPGSCVWLFFKCRYIHVHVPSIKNCVLYHCICIQHLPINKQTNRHTFCCRRNVKIKNIAYNSKPKRANQNAANTIACQRAKKISTTVVFEQGEPHGLIRATSWKCSFGASSNLVVSR